MPLYPDEIAFRVLRSRYLADGAMAYGLLPCPSNARLIPIVLRPAAYVLSVVDFGLGWSMLRYVQLVGVMLVLVTVLAVTLRRNAIGAALITSAAFIGVVGSGVLLSRGEAPMLFLGVACVIGYGVMTRSGRGNLMPVLYLVVTTFLALLAFFIHQQALILAPVLLLMMIAIALATRSVAVRGLAGLCVVAMLAGAAASLTASQIKCPEFPAVAPAFAKMELNGLAKAEGWQGVDAYLLNKLPRYAEGFGFNAEYPINYLPGIDPALQGGSLSVLNAGIESAVLLNIVFAFVVLIVCGVGSVRRVVAQDGSLRERLAGWLLDPSFYLCLGIAGHLALLIYDVPTAFYRNFHIHFMLVMLNAIALSRIQGKARLLLWPVGIASVTLCVASTFTSREMDSQFTRGWIGPSIRVQTDWTAVRARVRDVADRCNISTRDGRIVIDDFTFDAMKQHPHLIPISYIGFALPRSQADAASLSRFFRKVPATAVIAQCVLVRSWGFNPQYESDGICCLKLPPAG